MELYIIRHGRTEWNDQQKIQGHSDIPLNETGRAQALETAQKLAGIAFDKVYTSPLLRASETAELATGLSYEQMIIEPRVSELSFGVMEGKRLDELPEDFYSSFAQQEIYTARYDAEPLDSLLERCTSFLKELAANHGAQERIAVFTHGGTIRALLCCMEPFPHEDFWKVRVENCAILRAMVDENGYHLCQEIIREGEGVR